MVSWGISAVFNQRPGPRDPEVSVNVSDVAFMRFYSVLKVYDKYMENKFWFLFEDFQTDC